MRIVKPRWTIETKIDREEVLREMERDGRTCYKSEEAITSESARDFLKKRLGGKIPHKSILEHTHVKVRFQCNRGVSHELVRHRIGAYSQESTRYCNYSKGRFGGEIFLIPMLTDLTQAQIVRRMALYQQVEDVYMAEIKEGIKPQQARDNLLICLKTEIVATYNLSQWRHVFTLRTDNAAHPQMRELMRPLLVAFRKLFPVVFDDVGDVTPVYKECPECGYDPLLQDSPRCDTCAWARGDLPLVDWIRYENEKLDKSGQ